jgi:hypothetical protein
MELKLLPKDALGEILKYLSNRELEVFGSLSKGCNEHAEYEWKKRLSKNKNRTELDLLDRLASTNRLKFWSRQYKFHFIHLVNTVGIKDVSAMCELVTAHPEVKQLVPATPFLNLLKFKLKDRYFNLDYEMFDFAKSQLEKLFPTEIIKMLNEE